MGNAVNVCKATRVIQEPLAAGYGVLRCDLDSGHDSDGKLVNLHHDKFQGVYWEPDRNEDDQEAVVRAEPSPFPPVKEEKIEQQLYSTGVFAHQAASA